MDDEHFNRLRLDREYMTDRLTEISEELKKLSQETDALKIELAPLAESDFRAGAIRRRRRYIARRDAILKEEREELTEERATLNRRIGALKQTTP